MHTNSSGEVKKIFQPKFSVLPLSWFFFNISIVTFYNEKNRAISDKNWYFRILVENSQYRKYEFYTLHLSFLRIRNFSLEDYLPTGKYLGLFFETSDLTNFRGLYIQLLLFFFCQTNSWLQLEIPVQFSEIVQFHFLDLHE